MSAPLKTASNSGTTVPLSNPNTDPTQKLNSTTMSSSLKRLGFKSGRTFSAFLVLSGITFAFCLWKSPLILPRGMARRMLKAEWFWFKEKWLQWGLQIHLATCLPAGMLSVFQFVPYLRNTFRSAHRLNGRTIFSLLCISNVGGIMISPRSFGGSFSTQAWALSMAIMTWYAIYRSWTAVRQPRPNIVEHRRWAIRTMFWLASIYTTRIILTPATFLVTRLGDYYTVIRCDELEFILRHHNQSERFNSQYGPSCRGTSSLTPIPILATRHNKRIEEISSAVRWSFDGSLWLALTLHVLAVEYYLKSSSPLPKKYPKAS